MKPRVIVRLSGKGDNNMSLFHEEYGTYNDDARTIDAETTKAIRPIFNKWVKKGYKLKEIAYVVRSNIDMEECERRLTRNSKIAKEKRKCQQKQT